MPGRLMCWRCCAVRTESEIRDIFAQCVEACKKYNEFEAIEEDLASDQITLKKYIDPFTGSKRK